MPRFNMGRRTQAQLYADLREVFSLYDLEIVKDDGMWLWRDDYTDTLRIHLAPFYAHKKFDGNSGEKPGTRTEFGPKPKLDVGIYDPAVYKQRLKNAHSVESN